MGFSKGQSGTEYLSNYTIAAVVVLIIIGALVYLGVLNPSQPDICIFQKGLGCETFYLKQGIDNATLKVKNQFDDAIVIAGVICSAELVNPGTALPSSRAWTDGYSVNTLVNNKPVTSTPGTNPVVLAAESFDLNTYCYAENGNGMGSILKGERFKGIVFIRYRFNSSPSIMGYHVIQGNLQGKMN